MSASHILAAGLLASVVCTARAQTLDDVVVSANRSEQARFDAPGSIHAVGRSVIEQAGPQINISEALAGATGIHVANRNNFSQDLQISIRGFGSRAPFGVRGVRLLIDGLPQILPDGQGQSSQFALTSADRIEVLKGPLSLLHGNAAGGVVQVMTRAPSDQPEFSFAVSGGAYGLLRTSTQYSETRGRYGLLVDYATFSSKGFRQHSDAQRQHLNAKLVHTGQDSQTTFLANILSNDTEDPGSLDLNRYQDDRRQAAPGSITGQLGKTFVQGVIGMVSEQRLSSQQRLSYRAYVGTRDLDNPLPGSFSMIDRTFYGGALAVSGQSTVARVAVTYTAGLEVDYVWDHRKAEDAINGKPNGMLMRREDNLARNTDLFAQTQWFFNDRTTGLLGLRATRVQLGVRDQFFDDDLDGSGERTYAGLSPVIGLTRHVSPALNLFIQYGRGFETPTLNEILYTTAGNASINKFNGQLSPARSRQLELGLKWQPSRATSVDLSIFHAATQNDLAPDYLSSSGSTWQNADTKRWGYELSLYQLVTSHWALRSAYTQIQAKRVESGSGSVSQIESGKAMPGIPQSRFFADLAWRSTGWVSPAGTGPRYFEFGAELTAVGRQYVNSDNSAKTSAYEIVSLRAAHHLRQGPHQVSLFIRLDNAFDRPYVGSVVVDRADGRYYEPGAPRHWLLGIKYTRRI